MSDGHEILCACAALTKEGAAAALAAARGSSFDDFLRATGAGRDCTACMLDLEYFFVEAPQPKLSISTPSEDTNHSRASLKQRVYGVLDRLPPEVAYNRSNWMPILFGARVEQYLWMANHSLLFKDADDIAEFDIRFTIRGPDGRIVFRGHDRLAAGQMLRHNLSCHLDAADNLAVGSVQLDRLARSPAVRGTTRPQIEVLTSRSAATLHFQAATPGYNKTLSLYYRPEEETNHLTVVNSANFPLRLAVDYSVEGAALDACRADLKPFESRLFEIKLSEEAQSRVGDRLLEVRLRTNGMGKIHILNSRDNYSRLSLDHL